MLSTIKVKDTTFTRNHIKTHFVTPGEDYIELVQKYVVPQYTGNEYLFISHPITHLSNQKEGISCCTQSCIECMVRKLGKKVNVEAYPHKFRRTAATNAVRKGMPIEQVQKMLGHATLNTTQIYVNVSDLDVKISHNKYLS